jgi:hypothetical protein
MKPTWQTADGSIQLYNIEAELNRFPLLEPKQPKQQTFA